MENNDLLGPIFQKIRNRDIKTSKQTFELLDKYYKLLNQSEIDLNLIKEFTSLGIPDEVPGLRSLIWKLLFGYLPTNKKLWGSTLQQFRSSYSMFCSDFLSKTLFSELNEFNIILEKYERTGQTATWMQPNDAYCPLPLGSDSKWNMFWNEQELWDDIEKDAKRTRSEISLFSQPTAFPKNEYVSLTKYNKKSTVEIETHQDVITRILYVYAKLNPGVKYVQGMNELLALIYFTFQQDVIVENIKHAENDSFFCFSILMGEVKDGFIKSLDFLESGIKTRMKSLNNLLKKTDFALWNHLETIAVDYHYYSLRWLMLFLTQEFELVDVLRIWDSLLCHHEKIDFLYYLCLALMLILKKEVMEGDFSTALQRLQKVGDIDVLEMLSLANLHFKTNK